MHSNLTNLARGLALALAVAVLGGCATSKEKLLTHGDRTMMDIWQQEAGDGGGGGSTGHMTRRQLLDAGALLAEDVDHGEELDAMLRRVRLPRILVGQPAEAAA